MKHGDVQSVLADYLEGDLPLSEQALVDAHLDACEACALEVNELRRAISLLRALPDPEPPADLADRVMARVRAGEARPGWLPRLGAALSRLGLGRGTAPIALPVTAVAAGLAVAVVTGQLEVPDLLGWAGEEGAAAEQIARAPRPAPAPERIAAPRPAPAPEQIAAPRPAPAPERIERRVAQAAGATAIPESRPIRTPAEPAGAVLVDTRSQPQPTVAQVTGELLPRHIEGARVVHSVPTGFEGPSIEKAERARIELDRRLDLLLRSPAEFARDLRRDSIAAQELWLTELAKRAHERDLTEQVVDALRQSADVEAMLLAPGLEEALRRLGADVVAAEPVRP
ncbi:MAG: zf-HC2 domain-containing protein [Proteobacteria bacterium]|nr:zf-HC2 domain-containing protein [Pseudomonadota bacterium]